MKEKTFHMVSFKASFIEAQTQKRLEKNALLCMILFFSCLYLSIIIIRNKL